MSYVSGRERLERAKKHEIEVMERLKPFGINAVPFGQGLLPDHVRNVLKRYKTPIRWMPDILAFRDRELWVIDAKGEILSNTPNHSIENSSLWALRRFETAFCEDVVLVWADFSCSLLSELRKPWLRPGPPNSRGSGTPYWLYPKSRGRTMPDVFGETLPMDDDSPRLVFHPGNFSRPCNSSKSAKTPEEWEAVRR